MSGEKVGMIMKSFLIRDTTKKERQKIVNDAIALSKLSGLVLSDYAVELNQKYINGEIELNEIKPLLLKHYGVKNQNV